MPYALSPLHILCGLLCKILCVLCAYAVASVVNFSETIRIRSYILNLHSNFS
jgi:hypothetical protein